MSPLLIRPWTFSTESVWRHHTTGWRAGQWDEGIADSLVSVRTSAPPDRSLLHSTA